MKRWPMAITGILGSLAVGLLVVSETGAQGGHQGPDLVVTASGSAADGELMTLACGLSFAVVPSNTFLGQCRVTVGADQMALAGLDVDGAQQLTVVLNGEVTVRGAARSATGRFQRLVGNGQVGFPVYLHVDPLSRAWSIRADTPSGTRQIVSSGLLADGTITLTMP
jgi:hypothetical protein